MLDMRRQPEGDTERKEILCLTEVLNTRQHVVCEVGVRGDLPLR